MCIIMLHKEVFPALNYLMYTWMTSIFNKLEIGCCIGNRSIDHFVYADHICSFAPSVKGQQKLINMCEYCANLDHMIF